MAGNRESGLEQPRSKLPIDDVVNHVRRALAAQAARQEAVDVLSSELRPGDVPEGWPFLDISPHAIRAPLRQAEEILRELVDVTPEGKDSFRVTYSREVVNGLNTLDRDALREFVVEKVHYRLNASWSYIDVVSSAPLILRAETPILFMMTAPLGDPHKGHMVIGEEHNQSGIHFHYAKLDGKRSDILFGFGKNTTDPEHPVKWERHGRGKAKFHPKPEIWNLKKRKNINEVCCAARKNMPAGTRFFTPSKESRFLLPI